MARPREDPIAHAAQSSTISGPFPRWRLLKPQYPAYVGLPGGPQLTIQQLRNLTFSQNDYDRLRGGPDCDRGILWSHAIKLASRSTDFEDAFIEVITSLLAGRQHLTPHLQARCRRRVLVLPELALSEPQ
eukprot:11987795-Heterocapsa_arctica.AAC.1